MLYCKPIFNKKNGEAKANTQIRTSFVTRNVTYSELCGINPKGGDLYVSSLKPIERLVEERRSIDVQIIFSTRV